MCLKITLKSALNGTLKCTVTTWQKAPCMCPDANTAHKKEKSPFGGIKWRKWFAEVGQYGSTYGESASSLLVRRQGCHGCPARLGTENWPMICWLVDVFILKYERGFILKCEGAEKYSFWSGFSKALFAAAWNESDRWSRVREIFWRMKEELIYIDGFLSCWNNSWV